MCGLFGWYLKPGEFTLDEKGRMIEVLVKGSDWRGGDSWGVAVPQDTRYEIYKGLGKLWSNQFATSLPTFDVVYGHTRKATTGVVSLRNAHPFQVNHIIGAHNGIVYGANALNTRHKRNCTVDSQHIFYHLSERKPLDSLSGWGAFWWFRRATPMSLSLFKEDNYCLDVYGIGVHGKRVVGIVFASDDRDIETALRAMGRPFFPYKFTKHEEFKIPSWETLQYTGVKMRFGLEMYSGRVDPPAPMLPLPTHLPYDRRSAYFSHVTAQCTACGAPRVFLYDTVCGDCLERMMSGVDGHA